MKTLLTGFRPFETVAVNPSQLIVESLATQTSANLVTEVLPTEFIEAGKRIVQLIREHRPQRIICLGVAPGIRAIHLERVALNLDDTVLPDNAGISHDGKPIIADGPAAYWSTLSIKEICAELKRRNIPAAISNHAGTYVCNHVFYLARHQTELLDLGSQCGFIHLPQITKLTGNPSQEAEGLPINVMMEAIECCIQF